VAIPIQSCQPWSTGVLSLGKGLELDWQHDYVRVRILLAMSSERLDRGGVVQLRRGLRLVRVGLWSLRQWERKPRFMYMDNSGEPSRNGKQTRGAATGTDLSTLSHP